MDDKQQIYKSKNTTQTTTRNTKLWTLEKKKKVLWPVETKLNNLIHRLLKHARLSEYEVQSCNHLRNDPQRKTSFNAIWAPSFLSQ
jgi:hypothetical protein